MSARNLDVIGESSEVSLCFHSSSMDANKDNYGVSQLDSFWFHSPERICGYLGYGSQSGISDLVMLVRVL